MKTIGQRIAQAREAAGLNQSELARALKVTPQSVQAWESGKNTPRHRKLEGIAECLRVPLMTLIGDYYIELKLNHGGLDAGSETSPTKDLVVTAISSDRLVELISKAASSGLLQPADVQVVWKVVEGLIARNSNASQAPQLPDDLHSLAESAFTHAEAGGDSEDLVKMIGHGLKKSGAKESSSPNAKRKTGTD